MGSGLLLKWKSPAIDVKALDIYQNENRLIIEIRSIRFNYVAWLVKIIMLTDGVFQKTLR